MPTAIPIATAGEVFEAAQIELVRDPKTQDPHLLLWDRDKETIGRIVKYRGQCYEPVAINRGLLRELMLPTRRMPHGSTAELLVLICKLITEISALPEKLVRLVGRLVLATWLLEATQTAPALAIIGPDDLRGTNLFNLMHSLCRHPVRVTSVTPARLYTLPSDLGCTLLINQSSISPKLQRSLDDASRRDQKILHRGDMLNLHGCQVIRSEYGLENGPWSSRFVQVPTLPTCEPVPLLDAAGQERIASDFQPKLLNFRLTNLGKAGAARVDVSSFSPALRSLVQSLAVATPDDTDLQAEMNVLLRDEDVEARSARWVDRDTVVIEAILFACSENNRKAAYIGYLAEIATEILKRRGEMTVIDPAAMGKALGPLGFAVEPRDAKGVKLALTKAVCAKAQQLARDFGVPKAENENSGSKKPEGRVSRKVNATS
jgi:hypothetical protein